MNFEKIKGFPVSRINVYRAQVSGGWLVSVVGDCDYNTRYVRHSNMRVDSGMAFIPDSGFTNWVWKSEEHPHDRINMYTCELPEGLLIIQEGKNDHTMVSFRTSGIMVDISVTFVPNS